MSEEFKEMLSKCSLEELLNLLREAKSKQDEIVAKIERLKEEDRYLQEMLDEIGRVERGEHKIYEANKFYND